MRVLLVEDDRQLSRIVSSHLESLGFDVSCVERVGTALDELDAERHDIVVSDYELPDGTGLEVIERSAVPVVVCTGRAEPELAAKLISSGASDVLTKPFSLEQLRSALTAALADRG